MGARPRRPQHNAVPDVIRDLAGLGRVLSLWGFGLRPGHWCDGALKAHTTKNEFNGAVEAPFLSYPSR